MEKAKKVWQTTLKNGQDKKSATSKASSTFESRRKASAEQAGNPLFLGEETVEKSDKRQRRYIRIRDQTLWEKIDRIMEEEEYRKSFNKVINDALYFGLDELIRHLFERGDDKRGARATPKTKTDTEAGRSEQNILYGDSEVVEGGNYQCNNQ